MPHFVIECSENILESKNPEEILINVFNSAVESNLFNKDRIKVRILPYKYFLTGGKHLDFIHINAQILKGRNMDQKLNLSKILVINLTELYPKITSITANIIDMEKDCYSNQLTIRE